MFIPTRTCKNVETLSFCHWNLNGTNTRDTFLDTSAEEEKLFIQSFSKEIWRSDHPRDSKQGGVCLSFKEDLPIKGETDLEIMDETIVAEISIKRKKIIFVVTYRSRSQKAEDFRLFLDRLKLTLDYIKDIKPYSIVLTGDFNCKSSHWRIEDTELPESTALDELTESNNLFQLIDQPIHIRRNSRSCTDLIILTKQIYLFRMAFIPL